jgi:hypothetical protein
MTASYVRLTTQIVRTPRSGLDGTTSDRLTRTRFRHACAEAHHCVPNISRTLSAEYVLQLPRPMGADGARLREDLAE